MTFFEQKKKKPSDLFARAGVFSICFFIVMIFFITISKHVKSDDPQMQLMNGMAKYTSFDEKKKEQLKARNAGFWQYASDTNATNSMIYMTDRFELKPNGIFWQVTEYTLGLPSNKSTRFLHIVNGYLNPFAKTDTSFDRIVCDMHIIRQASVMGNDTCYGASGTDTTWEVVANGKRFECENRVYASYDTSGQALYAFFPKGALDIIDKITIYQCAKATGFLAFAKNAIAADMVTVIVEKLTQDAVQKIIDAYYRFFLENTVKTSLEYNKGKKGTGQIKASFDITWEGKVADVKILSLSRKFENIRQSIISNIGSWTFPRLKVSAPSIHIERDFWF
jgi:hypothetical protein